MKLPELYEEAVKLQPSGISGSSNNIPKSMRVNVIKVHVIGHEECVDGDHLEVLVVGREGSECGDDPLGVAVAH